MGKDINPWLAPKLSGLSQDQESAALARALDARYGPDYQNQLNSFAGEIGLGKVPIKVHTRQNLMQGGEPLLGEADPNTNVIKLDSGQSGDSMKATLAHELAHLADDQTDPAAVYATTHHLGFNKFEPEMTLSLEAQRAIESGLPVDPAVKGELPWLNSVVPLSSNRLANPWVGRQR